MATTLQDIVKGFDILASGDTTGLQAKQPREIRAGGPGSGCHGPNCGRHGGGKGTDKTHVPKSATVAKQPTESVKDYARQIPGESFNKRNNRMFKGIKDIKMKFTSQEIAKVKKIRDNFVREHDKDWLDENPDYKESMRDQTKGLDYLVKSMQQGRMHDSYFHGLFNVDDENYPEVTRAISRVLSPAMKRDSESLKKINRYWDEFA